LGVAGVPGDFERFFLTAGFVFFNCRAELFVCLTPREVRAGTAGFFAGFLRWAMVDSL
jgi:hypothetical protein